MDLFLNIYFLPFCLCAAKEAAWCDMDEQHQKEAKHYDTLLGHLDRLSNAPVGTDSIANARCTMTEAQQAFKVLLCRTRAPHELAVLQAAAVWKAGGVTLTRRGPAPPAPVAPVLPSSSCPRCRCEGEVLQVQSMESRAHQTLQEPIGSFEARVAHAMERQSRVGDTGDSSLAVNCSNYMNVVEAAEVYWWL